MCDEIKHVILHSVQITSETTMYLKSSTKHKSLKRLETIGKEHSTNWYGYVICITLYLNSIF